MAFRRASLCEVAECASGSMSTHVYEATECPDFRVSSRPVAMPPQISTRWMMGLRGSMYVGGSVRGGFGGGLEGRGGSLGGGRGDMAAGQTGKGLMGRSAGRVKGCPFVFLVFGKNLSCSIVMLHAMQRAGPSILWIFQG